MVYKTKFLCSMKRLNTTSELSLDCGKTCTWQLVLNLNPAFAIYLLHGLKQYT